MIYLYDVICYAHPRTSVPTNNARLPHAHTHTYCTPKHHDVSISHPGISTHTREHTQTCTCVLISLFSSLSLFHALALFRIFSDSISLVRVIYVSAFTGEYMPMYVRVHIQSTSRLCFFVFFFFYGDYNFVTAFDWKKKQQGTSRPSINVITESTSSLPSLSLSSSLSSVVVILVFSRHEQNSFDVVQNIRKQRKQ